MQLNKEAYEVNRDALIYDRSHPVDAVAVELTVSEESAGLIQRGQVLDFNKGAYSLHKKDGDVSVIVSESTPYTEEDTKVVVPVYISGTFRKSACIADEELTDTDVETFRSKGIYLK